MRRAALGAASQTIGPARTGWFLTASRVSIDLREWDQARTLHARARQSLGALRTSPRLRAEVDQLGVILEQVE